MSLEEEERLNRSFHGSDLFVRIHFAKLNNFATCVCNREKKNDVDFTFTINLIQIKIPMTQVGKSC